MMLGSTLGFPQTVGDMESLESEANNFFFLVSQDLIPFQRLQFLVPKLSFTTK